MATDIVALARALAERAHAGQTYSGASYFEGHLRNVAAEAALIVALHPELEVFRPCLVAAAWLHDVLEDTKTPLAEVTAINPMVAELVLAVTDAPGPNRKARKAATYPQIHAAGPLAVALKLADRIANVRAAVGAHAAHFLKMYREEQPEFRAALWQPGELEVAWATLEALLAEPSPVVADPERLLWCWLAEHPHAQARVQCAGDHWVVDLRNPVSLTRMGAFFVATNPHLHTAIALALAGVTRTA